MDSFVEMGEDNIPHPLLRAGSKMAGNFGRVSAVAPDDVGPHLLLVGRVPLSRLPCQPSSFFFFFAFGVYDIITML